VAAVPEQTHGLFGEGEEESCPLRDVAIRTCELEAAGGVVDTDRVRSIRDRSAAAKHSEDDAGNSGGGSDEKSLCPISLVRAR